MPLRRLVILHGYTAHPGKHWFGWLSDRLAPLGVETVVPALPETDAPHPGPWTDAAVAAIGAVGPDVAVVGHSLGTITAIRALGRVFAEQPDARLGLLVLVAPFVDPVPDLAELDGFTQGLPSLGALADRIDRRIVVRSDADPTVPIELATPVVEGLRAELVVVPGAGHFTEAGGRTTFPELLELLVD